jgi:outer membrane protein assembly factor BamA
MIDNDINIEIKEKKTSSKKTGLLYSSTVKFSFSSSQAELDRPVKLCKQI